MSLTLDILTAVTILAIIAWSAWRGFVEILLSVAGKIVVVVAAFLLSGLLADWIFDAFIRDAVVEQIGSTLGSAVNAQSTAEAVQQSFDALPKFLTAAAGLFGLESGALAQNVENAVASGSLSLSAAIAEQAVQPVATMLVRGIVFVVLMIIGFLILRAVIKPIDLALKLPLVGSMNALLGGILGVIYALLIVFVATALIHFFGSITGYSLFSKQTISETHLFRYICEINPLIRAVQSIAFIP